MTHFLPFAILLLLGAGAGSLAANDFGVLFSDRVSNALGNADRYGFASYWCEVPPGLEIAGKEVSLAFRFCTAPESRVGELFGDNWFCPLLESCVVEHSEAGVFVWTPGGQKINLLRKKESEGSFASSDTKWTAVQKGSKFVLTGAFGDQLTFKEGLVESYKSSEGRDYEWIREAGRAVSIIEKGRLEPLLTAKQNKEGLVDSVTSDKRSVVKFKYQQLPRMAKQFEKSVVVGLKSVLSGILGEDSALGLAYQLSEDSEKMSLKVTDSLTGISRENLNWSIASGILESDATHQYDIESQGEGIDRPRLVATDKHGNQRWYAYNPKTGIAEKSLSESRVRIQQYILTPGAAMGKTRKLETKNADGTISDGYRAFYTPSGQLFKEIWDDGKELAYFYDSRGTLTKIALMRDSAEVFSLDPESLSKTTKAKIE